MAEREEIQQVVSYVVAHPGCGAMELRDACGPAWRTFMQGVRLVPYGRWHGLVYRMRDDGSHMFGFYPIPPPHV